MADNSVFITGAAPGALAEAMEGLPTWATEDTAKSIELILKQSLGIQTKTLSEIVKKANSGSLDPEQVEKLNSELEDLIKNFQAENTQDRKHRADEANEHKKKKKRWEEEDKQSLWAEARSTLLLGIANQTYQALKDNVNVFDQLYRSGIGVVSGFNDASNGFEALRQMTVLSGVRFTELADTMEKFSTAVNSFGAAKFAKTMGAASSELTKFGFSTKETGELLGAYLESQRGFTDVNSRTQEQIQKDLVNFGQRITRVSTATGMLRNKLLENVDAISKSVEATILAGQIGASAAGRTQEFIASFGDQRVGNAFLRMMTDAIKPLNTTFMDFQKIGFGGFGQKLMEFTQSIKGLDPEEQVKLTAEFTKANKAELDRIVQHANLLRQVGSREAEGALSMVAGMQQQARAYKELTKEERDKLEATAQSSKELQNAIERFKAQIQMTFAPLPAILDTLTGILQGVNWVFDQVRNIIEAGEKFISSFDIINNMIGEVKILPFVGLGLAIYSIIKSISLLDRLITSTVKRNSVAGAADSLGGAAGGGRGGRTGRGMGVLGGISEGVGGVLGSLARGIGSFANPKILLGASILAGSITVIGAGIAGATWILGASLPKFAEGIKSFDGINGGNLVDVAKGVASLGGAIVAFGAGSAIGGIGGAIGAISNSFSKLLGNGTIVDQLKIFASLGDGLAKTAAAISGITAAINNLDTIKAAAFSQLGAAKNISLPPLTGVPSVMTTPRASTLNSPSKVSSSAGSSDQAVAKEPSRPTATGIEKGPADTSINSMLSYQNSLMEQLVLSTNNLVSVNKDILKYTKVHS